MSDLSQNTIVNLQVNGQQAKETLEQLKQRAFHLSNALAQASDKTSKIGKTKMKQLQKELNKTNAEIKRMQSSSEQVEQVLHRLDRATPKELKDTLRTLNKQLDKLERGSSAWEMHSKKIKKVKEELAKVNDNLKVSESKWDKMNRKLNEMQTTLMAGAAAVAGLVQAGRAAVSAYADMDAEMANVRKYTGMTADQVERLNSVFMQMDTRTSREELNKLAQEAGRLGKTSEEDILGFVRASDQINVALDELGEGATLTLSKLTNIFGDEERLGTERALLAVGSVINDLSQNSTASAAYLANFSKRLAGVGNQAGMTIPQIMAFGAVLDSQGQAVEMSATALSKLIMELFKKTDTIAKATGLDLIKFKEALNSSTNEGLIMLLEQLNQLGGIDVLAPVFKDMGENGARASSVISALAGNIDTVKKQQIAANSAFREATSVTKEYNVQNNTVQAGLDKMKKKFKERAIELGQKLLPVMGYAMTTTSLFLRALNTIVDFIKNNWRLIVTLTSAITGYYLAIKIATIWEYRHRISMIANYNLIKAQIVAIRIFKIIIAACTFNVKALTTSWNKLNASMKRNIFGLILAVVASVVAYIWEIADGLGEIDEFTKNISDSLAKARGINEEYAKEKKSLDALFKSLKNATKGSKEYKDIKNQIISQYGVYLKGLINEKGEIINLEDAYNRLNIAVEKNAKLKGIKAAEEEIQTTYYTSIQEDLTKFEQSLKKYGASEEKQKEYMKYMSELITNGTPIPQNILKEIKNLNTWALAENIFGQNKDKPLTIYNRIAEKTNKYIGASNQLKTQEGILRPYENADEQVINWAIQSINDLIKSGKESGNIMKLYKDSNGNVITEYTEMATSEAKRFLTEYQWELAQRGIELQNKINPNANLTPTLPEVIDDGKESDKTERFAAQKEERSRKETINKIDFVKGDIDALEYQKRNIAIEKEYYDNISKLTDLSNKEILEIKLGYAENEQKSLENISNISIKKLEEEFSKKKAIITQNYIENKLSTNAYNLELEKIETKFLYDKVKMTRKGSKERIRAEQELTDFQLKNATEKKKKLEAIENKIKKDFFGDNNAENKAKYEQAMSALDNVYQAELIATQGNEKEKLRITEAYEKAKLALKKKYNDDAIEDNSNSWQRANDKMMEWLKSDQGKAVTQTFDTIVSGMSSIFSQVSSLVQTELEIETAEIEKRYEKEIALAQGNTYKIQKIEKRKEREIAKAKNDANRKMFAMQVIQAIAQTAQNALAAYGSAAHIPLVGYIIAPIAAAMATAAGLMQVSIIKKQQEASLAQGYAKGGFTKVGTKYEPAGIVHAGEWVASQELLANPVARPVINALDYAQRNNRIASLRSEDVSNSITAPAIIAQNTNGNIAQAMTANAVALASYASAINALNKKLDEPFVTVNTVTGDMGIQKAQDDYNKLLKNKSSKF